MIDLRHIERYRETNQIEAKLSVGGLPGSLWERYSAFANTLGGVILLGVEEYEDRSLHPVDLPDPEELLREFWAILNDRSQVSANILTDRDVTWLQLEDKDVIAIRVPAATAAQRPVYIGCDPYTGSYYRDGDGDYRLSREAIRRMLAEAAQVQNKT